MRTNRVFRKAAGLLVIILVSIAQTASPAANKVDLRQEKQTMVTLSKTIADEDIRAPLVGHRLPGLLDFLPLTIINADEVDAALDFDWRMLEFKSDPHLIADSPPNPTTNNSEPRSFGILDSDLFRFQEPGEPIPTPAVLILVGLIALIALKRRRR